MSVDHQSRDKPFQSLRPQSLVTAIESLEFDFLLRPTISPTSIWVIGGTGNATWLQVLVHPFIYICTHKPWISAVWCLTSLAVIPSMTRGRGRMQKTVTMSLTRGMYSETDGHSGVVIVVLRCGESVINWPFVAEYQLATLRVCTAT